MKNLPWRFPFCLISKLKVYYICTIMWEEFTSVVLNRCVIWNRNVTNCRRWSATPKPLQLIQSHIWISVLRTSVFLWRFGDNKNVLLFPTILLYMYVYQDFISDKLGLKFTVSQQFTSNFFRLQGTPLLNLFSFRCIHAYEVCGTLKRSWCPRLRRGIA